MLIKKSQLLSIILLLSLPFFVLPVRALAVNDVSISDDTNFEILTSDTAVATTITASTGGQVTNFNVETNYIDITLDNASDVDFSVATANRYFKITKQSGSNDYTVSPTCPTTSVTLTGTGATVILRLQVQTTNPCGNGDGGGRTSSGGYIPPVITPVSPAPALPTPLILPITESCIPETTFTRLLTLDSRGEDVLRLQEILERLGFHKARIDGIFGPITRQAVIQFQISKNLQPYPGWVGPATRQALNALNECKSIEVPKPGIDVFTRYLSLGSNGADVLKLQEILLKLGYYKYSLGPTGYFGPVTRLAVIDFQKANIGRVLTAPGWVGPYTRGLLNEINSGL